MGSTSMPGTRYETVLDYVQDGTGVQIVDFSVSDDTQVDFAAIAISLSSLLFDNNSIM